MPACQITRHPSNRPTQAKGGLEWAALSLKQGESEGAPHNVLFVVWGARKLEWATRLFFPPLPRAVTALSREAMVACAEMPLPFWRRNKPKVASTVAEDRPPAQNGTVLL